jgi:hypothetical protein
MLHIVSRSIVATILILNVIFNCGCATIIKGSSETIYVYCSNGIAKVYIDGSLVGSTPLALDLPTKNVYRLEVRMDGYEDQGKLLTPNIDVGWVVADILCGFLPVFIDGATGSWFTFDTIKHEFTLTMKESK